LKIASVVAIENKIIQKLTNAFFFEGKN